MAVLRHVVFPALRLLVWSVIAVSLAVLAFGRGDALDAASGPAQPWVEVAPAEVEVSRGTVENVVRLQGTVSADPDAVVRSTAAGVVSRVRVAVGDRVEAGARLLDVRVELEPLPVTPPADGSPAPEPRPRSKVVAVTAPASGVVSALDALVDQVVSVGDEVARTSPGTLSIEAPLTQEQQFRLLAPPTEASVVVPGGGDAFTCTEVRTGAAAAGSAPPPVQDPYGAPVEPSTARATCRVPAGALAFAGMTATVELEAGTATDVLVVPVTAVRGSVGTGTAFVLDADGATEERPVVLGLTDGAVVEVREGLAEGDRVLEFVPGQPPAFPVGGGEVFYG